ncbi:Ubiquinone biosynthesis O-methyltransferase [Pseudosulfitobacter sp. DSM 107133]|nr:Ubiquinone biosynthesis O-methyltransferase [Pseudosulfitobacter sp. DSM 107133]
MSFVPQGLSFDLMHSVSTYRPCPLCESTQCVPLRAYSPDPWQVVTCDECSMTYLRNPVVYEALEQDFAWEKTYAAKAEASKGSTFASKFVRKLRTNLGVIHRDKQAHFRRWFSDGHVLDIGCGAGARILPPMTPFGIELSTALHAQADDIMRSRGGYCLKGAGAETIWEFDEAQFDGIVMFSYLEHETNVMGVLNGVYRALKNTGAVFVRVPNFNSLNRKIIGPKWCGFRYPDHVNYFSLRTLRKAAADAGFTTKLVNSFSLPVDDNISVLLRKVAA